MPSTSSPTPIDASPGHLRGNRVPRAHIEHVGAWLAMALWGAVSVTTDWRTGEIGESFVHAPLQAFHQLGHLLMLPFGRTLSLLGGTLAQLAIPLAFALNMRRRGDRMSEHFCLWVLGVSMLDVAAYMHDARHLTMKVLSEGVGEGGLHDWRALFADWGLLDGSASIAAVVFGAGAVLIAYSVLRGAAQLNQDHRERRSQAAALRWHQRAALKR